jgi:hypothetical protein
MSRASRSHSRQSTATVTFDNKIKKVGSDAAVYDDKVADQLEHRYNQARPSISPYVKASFSREALLQRESTDVPPELVPYSQLAQQNGYLD